MANGNGGFRISWAAMGPILAALAMIFGLVNFIRAQDMRAMETRIGAAEDAIRTERVERKEEVEKVYRLLERMDSKLDDIQKEVRR